MAASPDPNFRPGAMFRNASVPGPVGDQVLVLPAEASRSIGGLERPETQTRRASEGVVVQAGPGRVTEHGVRIPPEVRPGDRVAFADYSGHDILLDLDGEEKLYRALRQDEIVWNFGPSTEAS